MVAAAMTCLAQEGQSRPCWGDRAYRPAIHHPAVAAAVEFQRRLRRVLRSALPRIDHGGFVDNLEMYRAGVDFANSNVHVHFRMVVARYHFRAAAGALL